MTLLELSQEYRAHAQLLKERVTLLSQQQSHTTDSRELLMLHERIRILHTMWREARDLAVFTEHYYERGYHRNAKYTI